MNFYLGEMLMFIKEGRNAKDLYMNGTEGISSHSIPLY